MAKPVICFDIDGTLVNDLGEIHPQDIEILSQPEPPALFIPGTGRLLASVCRLFTRHGMFLDRKIPFPLVLQNGAVVYAPDEVLLFSHLFSEPLSQELIDLVFQTPEVAFFIFLENHVFAHSLTDFSRNLQQRFDLEVEALQAGQNIRMNKVMAVSENQELYWLLFLSTGHYCIIRRKPTSDSDASRPLNLEHAIQRIRRKPTTFWVLTGIGGRHHPES